MFVCLFKSMCWNYIAQCGNFMMWGLWEVIRSWGWVSLEWDQCIHKRDPIRLCRMRVKHKVCSSEEGAHLTTLAARSWTSVSTTEKNHSVTWSVHVSIVCAQRMSSHAVFEKTVFIPLHCLCAWVKDQLTIFMLLYIWFLYLIPLIFLSILSQIHIPLTTVAF